MINILISDDNSDLVKLIFKEIIRKNKDFRLSDYTYDGIDAMESILKYYPEVLILDLKLPIKDGISIIEDISHLEYYSPYIIVISSFQNHLNKVYKYKNIYKIIFKGSNFDILKNDLTLSLIQINKEITRNQIRLSIKREIDYLILTILI